MFNYHNNLKKHLRQYQYIVHESSGKFPVRFIFPTLQTKTGKVKSMPIRDYRVPEYLEYIK